MKNSISFLIILLVSTSFSNVFVVFANKTAIGIDGSWGIDYIDEKVIMDRFEITKRKQKAKKNQYVVACNALVKGEVKETLNLFRNFLTGSLTLDISSYDSVQFEMYTNRNIEVILVTENLTDWNNRLRYKVPKTDKKKVYKISFSDFINGNKERGTIKKIRSIVFSVQGDYQYFYPFHLEISDVTFTSTITIDSISNSEVKNDETGLLKMPEKPLHIALKNYPNPFKTKTTIEVPEVHKELQIVVIDILGRIVRKARVIPNNKTITFEARNLIPGSYYYSINCKGKQKYQGKFLIQ